MKFKKVEEMYLGSNEVTNPEIKNLFKRNEVLGRDELKNILIRMEPMYPSLAHEVYRHSHAGIYQGLINKFTNIKSLSQQIQDHGVPTPMYFEGVLTDGGGANEFISVTSRRRSRN